MFAEFVEEQIILFIALGIIVVMLVSNYLSDKVSGYASVNADEAVRLMNRDANILDVRTDAEYKTGFIGEATNIPVSELARKIDSMSFAKDEPLLVYCQSGARSASASRQLVKNGYTQVSNLSGGIMAWKNASLPTNKPVSKKKSKKKEQQGS
jgi:rhodanese-related sulfurtransferase